ncbi:MAG: S-adenosylmethionine decarboxylase [Patescibacteria group bacterium]|jgi:S-adenosylmethionine decarboxylase
MEKTYQGTQLQTLTENDFGPDKAWGLHAVIDLYECDLSLISSEEQIRKFVIELCKEIGMKRHGETHIDRFGDGVTVSEGYSFMQFIETSSITAHFDEPYKKAFIDIFSCKFFEAEKAVIFSQNFFKSKKAKVTVLVRD